MSTRWNMYAICASTCLCLYMSIMMESGLLCALNIQSSMSTDVQMCVSEHVQLIV